MIELNTTNIGKPVPSTYSVPIYENGIKTEWSIDGIIGDETYLKLAELNEDGSLPALINVGIKKENE